MKKFLFIAFLILMAFGLSGQEITLFFSPSEINMNELSTFSFDPVNPDSQPILTMLSITNNGETQRIRLQVVVRWNGNNIVEEGSAVFISKIPLPQGETWELNNRDLITNQASTYFEADGNVNLNIVDILQTMPRLEEAIMAGYFPDGELQIQVSAAGEGSTGWDTTQTFTIKIQSAGSIYLTSPGRPIGQVPTDERFLPVSFLWNSVNTGFNSQRLVIKEFPPTNPPTISTVATAGTIVYSSYMPVESGFSEYLPFNPGYYYAWMVHAAILDEDTSDYQTPYTDPNHIQSNWFVFRYMDEQAGDTASTDFQAMLNFLENADLINLLLLGYTPTGEVIYEGRTYKGQDAIDLLCSLVGKNISVELKD